MEVSEDHVHPHEDDLVEIRIPGWVLWAAAGIVLGLAGVVAWDVYTQKRKARELATKLTSVTPHDRALFNKYNGPLLDWKKVEEWANGQKEKPVTPTVVQDEQPESPPL